MRVEKVLCDNELVHHIHLYGRKRSCKGVPSTLRGEIPHRPLPRREGLGGDKKQRPHTRKKKKGKENRAGAPQKGTHRSRHTRSRKNKVTKAYFAALEVYFIHFFQIYNMYNII